MIARTLRAVAATLAATVALGVTGTTVAQARPTRPGVATITSATATPGATPGSYAFSSTWTAAANATAYKVVLTNGGVTLASTTVTTLAWNESVTTTPGTGTLSVTAVAGHFKGATANKNVTFADVTAPRATYTSTWDNGTGLATITEQSVTDDSPVSQVIRTVNWHETPTSPEEAWNGATPLTHTYPLTEARYVPTVTLSDASGNTRVVDVPAVVINDKTAPTGTFAVAPGKAWATLTRVTLTQSTLTDNWTPTSLIGRSVAWGDGTTSDWTGTAPLTHVYAVAGTYTPQVTLTDEAHNVSAPLASSSAVVVTADTVKPVVRLRLPRAKHSVKAWTTLRGKATDTNGTGVKVVSLRAVEKRGTAWYGYQASTKRWVKAATMAKAFAKSRAFALHPSATSAWAGRLVGLRKGTLVYKVKATDKVGNVSATLTHKASLTRR